MVSILDLLLWLSEKNQTIVANETGIDRTLINKFCTGERKPTEDQARLISASIGVPPSWLTKDIPREKVFGKLRELYEEAPVTPVTKSAVPDYTAAIESKLEIYEDVSEAPDRHEIFILPYAVAADANPAHIDRGHSDGSVWLPERRGRRLGAKVYALRISGESMNQIIANGDLCFVRNTTRAKDGDIVIVAQDGSVTVKRWKGRQLLSESDRHYAPIQLYDTEDDASGNRIVGVVWGIHKPK